MGWLEGQDPHPTDHDFLLAEHLREDTPWCTRGSWAQSNPADMGHREAADQIFAESRVSRQPGRPATPQLTHTHTRAHAPLSGEICELSSICLFNPIPAPFN